MSPTLPGLNREFFPADATVFSLGAEGDCAYVIEHGCVEVLGGAADGHERLAVLEAGTLFGEVALLDRQPRSATVRTLQDTTLVRIERSHIDELLGRTDPVIQYLLRLLLTRIRNAQWVHTTHSPDAPAGAALTTAHADLHAQALRALSLAHDLSDALASDRLALHYQPIVSLADGRLEGYEALMRWQHPVMGTVPPSEFIGLAEKTGLIGRIGHWGLCRAAQDWSTLHALQADGPPPILNVNMSAPELCEPDVVERMQACLAQFGMPMDRLCVELTETTVVNNHQTVARTIEQLRTLGAGVAMDDFGTGYSGLDYLKNMAFSSIKIDRGFVQHMHTSQRSCYIIESALELSARLGVRTVAEGIEDAATAAALTALGCELGQGYFFAYPMPLGELAAKRTAARS